MTRARSSSTRRASCEAHATQDGLRWTDAVDELLGREIERAIAAVAPDAAPGSAAPR